MGNFQCHRSETVSHDKTHPGSGRRHRRGPPGFGLRRQRVPRRDARAVTRDQPAEAGYSAQASIPSLSEEWYEREKEQAESLFDEIEAEAESAGLAVERVIEVGKPTRTIVEYAREHDIDQIVMGSHGRSGDVLNSTRERRRERRQALAGPGHGDAPSSRRVRRREFCMFGAGRNGDNNSQKALGGLSTRADRAALLVVRESEALVITKGAERLSNDSAAVLTGPCFVHPASPFESTVRASSDELARKSEIFGMTRRLRRLEPPRSLRSRGPQGPHRSPALPWSADETASRPCGCGRKRDSARTRRIREEWGFKHQRVPEAARATRSWWTERARCAGRSTDP